MSVEVKVPILPESVTEATLLSWHKQVGEPVRRDENLVDIETEKVVLEVPAPQDGIIKQLVKSDGDTVLAEELIAIIEPQELSEQTPKSDQPAPAWAPATAQPATDGGDSSGPAVRKLLTEHGLDAATIPATGKSGRLTKRDVLEFLDNRQKPEAPAAALATATAKAPQRSGGERTERRESMSRLRATIASRLVQAQQTAAMLTTFNDVNLQAVMDLRQKYKDMFEEKHNARLGMMSFFVKASIEALKRFPAVNAYIDGKDLVYHDYYDIGIAAASPRGLVVPVIRDADLLSFAQVEGQISEYGKKARAGSLTMDDLTGGTFTITNGGVFGSMLSTPILNPPQSAILGMHRIEQRPVAENGEVVIRPMMYLALTYDHRIVDGAEAVRFLVTVKEALEDPVRLLLEV
ncbi:MAG: 2-oxoglutarate dehydrogenase complex dihydrolipoyllysine-residue succinyltransferase [Gammaproteobacteria bacterium]|nr:2-oxoglutarate dehydrogenase complex dihydrolipoyllysine-residue succinyltransferase [Gammaproteobacteria bacterium]